MKHSLPPNPFKRALRERRRQIGLWTSLCSPIAAEIVAGAGFDWVLVDGEHAPNDLDSILRQLPVIEGSGAAAVVRPQWNDPVLFKRLLDLGARNLLVPWIQNADEARAMVAATRYPPAGIRGVAVGQRANRYGRVTDYFQRADGEICLIAQLETQTALDNLESIAAVDGVDALFIGPSDLAAALGHLGDNRHPEVRAAIEDAVARIVKTGKAAGILAPVEEDARHWLEAGFTMVAVGSDLGILARATEQLAARFKSAD